MNTRHPPQSNNPRFPFKRNTRQFIVFTRFRLSILILSLMAIGIYSLTWLFPWSLIDLFFGGKIIYVVLIPFLIFTLSGLLRFLISLY